MDNKPVLYIMVGVPGSGKTTYAQNYLANDSTIILSSDDIRKELFGDEAIQSDPAKVFDLLYKRMNTYLGKGKNVVVDATNIDKAGRHKTFEKISSECIKKAVVISVDKEVAIRQNKMRKRRVKPWVIEKYFNKFEMPEKSEGFNEIIVINGFDLSTEANK